MNREWAARLEQETAKAVRDVLSTYPYEIDEQEIGPPVRTPPSWAPPQLAAFFEEVGTVSLPDIGNGYFLYPPTSVERLGDERIVVFGSTGGGDLYAMALSDGRVLRLREAACDDGVYSGGDIRLVGASLPNFLNHLLAAVTAFADHGHITD